MRHLLLTATEANLMRAGRSAPMPLKVRMTRGIERSIRQRCMEAWRRIFGHE